MGVTNSLSTISGIVAPNVTSALTKNVSNVNMFYLF